MVIGRMGSTVGLVALILAAGAVGAGAADRHADYYYPKPVTEEAYKARIEKMPEASRRNRIAFVTYITTQSIANNPYPPQYAMFAKGTDAEKMIIVSLYQDRYNTLYRMRGLLAMLTAVARTSPMIKGNRQEDNLTFLDLLKMMGFTQITVSDGQSFSHQIKIE